MDPVAIATACEAQTIAAIREMMEKIPAHDLTIIVIIALFLGHIKSEKKRKREADE